MNRTNRIKSELSNDNVVCGCMVAEMRTPAVAMILESAGLDFFIIDMEHGSFTYETAADIIVACRGLNIVPFVRVPGLDRESFQKVLDAGALGLLVPRIETAGEAEQAADLLRYAPEGSRGLSLRRAHSGFGRPHPAQFTADANRNLMLMVQIETKKGVENIDSISDVTGIDVLFVGPSDLAHSYGAGDAAQVERAIDRVVQVGREKGIPTGIHHSSLPYITRLVAQGMRFFSVNTEVGAIIGSFSDMTAAVRVCGRSGEGQVRG
jgi:2-keto-3-deoxy-L-rhamnonate aldolase RhmA